MKLIVAVDRNWAIGNKGELLVSIPGDQKFFKELTVGNVIIYGRKTMETFPGGRPLRDRTNIVMTGNPGFSADNALVAHDIAEMEEMIRDLDTESIFVVGGESVYRQLLPLCDTAYVTLIDMEYEADRFFPNLDEDPCWVLAEKSYEQTYFSIPYYFCRYERIEK